MLFAEGAMEHKHINPESINIGDAVVINGIPHVYSCLLLHENGNYDEALKQIKSPYYTKYIGEYKTHMLWEAYPIEIGRAHV